MLTPKVPTQVGSDATVIKLAAFKGRQQERANHICTSIYCHAGEAISESHAEPAFW